MNQSPKAAPVIYYSGHGEMYTGNWCFQNLQLGISEIVEPGTTLENTDMQISY